MDTRTGRDGTRSKVMGKFLVNALHAFHRFNRRYHVKESKKLLHITVIERAYQSSRYTSLSLETNEHF